MLFCTGSNSHGQLGLGDTLDRHSFAAVPSLPSAPASLALGANHSLALLPDGQLYTSGSNTRGQLGPAAPSTTFAHLPLELILGALVDPDRANLGSAGAWVVTGVAAAWETSFVHLRSRNADRADALVSMGANDWGEAGTATPTGQVNLVSFSHLLPRPTTLFKISYLAASPRHVLVSLDLPSESLVVGWGAARHGQLGSVSARTIPLPTHIPLPLSTTILQLALGRDHSALLVRTADSPPSTLLLGSNKHGQTSLPSAGTTSVVQIGCTWSGTYLLDASLTRVVCAGSNTHGQLAASTSPSCSSCTISLPPHRTVTRLVCGSEHVLALCDAPAGPEVWAWGWNEHGNLGDATVEDARELKRVWPPTGAEETHGPVVDLWAGNATSWIRRS